MRALPKLMTEEAFEAGLDLCDIRVSYEENRTSTPNRERVCSNDNLGCWNGGGAEDASKIREECITIHLEKAKDDDEASFETKMDLSYGGAWALDENDAARLANFTSISVFDISLHMCDKPQVPINLIRPLTDVSTEKFPISTGSGPKVNQNNPSEEKETKLIVTMSNVKTKMRQFPEQETQEIDRLEKNVCHIKSKNDKKQETNLTDFRPRKLKLLLNNIRGWFSKRESLEAILAKNKVDICALCETFTVGNRFPELPGFVTYYRNREARAAGGVAVLIREEVSKFVVKLEVGKKENEFMTLKITNCNPHLVLIVYYGTQSGTFGVDQVKLHISELLQVAKKYRDQGCATYMLGDFNLHIGNSIIKKNHPDDNPNGRIFVTQIEQMGLSIMNSLSPNPITFVDRSGKDHKEIVLDLVLTNQPATISNFVTDDESHAFTPYSVQMRKKVSSRTYADHRSIMFEVETMWQNRVNVKKEPIWNYKKQVGDLKFDLFTSNACSFLMNKIQNEKDINLVQKAFHNVITKGLFQSYGKRTITASKVTRINDDLVWRNRISDINKLHAQFQADKESNQVYKIRKSILKGQTDKQNVAVEVEESGRVLEDLEDILDYILDYNTKNMEKVPPSEQVKEIKERKAAVISLMLDDVSEFPDEIPWEIFIKVLSKVMTQKKACFRHIIKSGRDFKYALYHFVNRMYKEEVFPEESSETRLTKIWKRKGSQARLRDNRFIHGKDPYSKFLEKCMVEIIAEKLDMATPQLQAGSRKGRSTRDQLLKVIILQKHQESKGKPQPILLVDVRACFDRMVLDDVIYDTIEAGADRKAVRVLRKFSDKTIIKLKEDHRNDGKGVGRLVTGTLGQGSNFAPPGIGLTTSKSIKTHFEGAEHIMAKLGNVSAEPQSYVDDISTLPKDESGLREACWRIGKALEVISLESHPDKTEVVISGRNKKAQLLREKLTNNPAMMQGNPVKVSESGMYLGIKVSQEGFRDTINLTVLHRVAKAWGRVAELKSIINDARMSRLGWLRVGAQLIRSVIIPSLTYSADVWLAANKGTEKFLKDEYKGIIYVLLDIPTNTKWTSVLADLELPNIMMVVNKLRVNYMNHTLWGKGDVKLREMLWEEHRLAPAASMITHADTICDLYKLPRVSRMELDKGLNKRRFRSMDQIDNWMSNLVSSATRNVGLELTRKSTMFYKLQKREYQALLAFNAGAFKLKTAWGDYHEIQSCLAPMCGGKDELEHIKLCAFYKTKWEADHNLDSRQLAKYLVGIDKERRKNWKGECLF